MRPMVTRVANSRHTTCDHAASSMPAMRNTLGARLRLTVLGCSTAAPHPATPTAGFLVEWGSTAILLDCGQGVIRNLQKVLDPHDLAAIVIGHMHADHYLDIVGPALSVPVGRAVRPMPLPIHLPPGGSTAPRRARERRERAGRVLRCRIRRRRVRPGRGAPGRRPPAAVRPGAATTSRPGAWSSRRLTGRAWPTPATPVRPHRSRTRVRGCRSAARRERPGPRLPTTTPSAAT